MRLTKSTIALIISVIAAYVLTTLFTAAAWFLIMEGVIRKPPSLSSEQRYIYYNPFIEILGMISVFLLISFSLYGIIIVLFPKSTFPLALKVVIGMVTGLIPLVILGLMTFGINFSGNPLAQLSFSMMALGGGLLPLVQHILLISLKKKAFT